MADGEKTTVYITTLYKYGAPQIRLNVNDISAYAAGSCPCGGSLRRLERIFGRNAVDPAPASARAYPSLPA